MLNTRPTTLAVHTGATAMIVEVFHRGGVNLNRWVGGRKDRPVRQMTEMASWSRRNVRGKEEVFRTHLLLSLG